MEHQPPHPNAENMVNYWVFRKQDAIHSLEVAIRNLDYFNSKVEENKQALENAGDNSLSATDHTSE